MAFVLFINREVTCTCGLDLRFIPDRISINSGIHYERFFLKSEGRGVGDGVEEKNVRSTTIHKKYYIQPEKAEE